MKINKARKEKAEREILNLHVQYISLVDKPANKKTIIFKSAECDGKNFVYSRTVEIKKKKEDGEKYMVYGIVAAPDEVDTDGETISALEIEAAMERFMCNGYTNSVDKQHNEWPDEGFVKESWLVRKGDPLFPDEPEGAWAVGIKIKKIETWNQIKSGEIGGISLGGFAEKRELEKSENNEITTFFQKLTEVLKKSKEVEMNKEEITALVTETVKKSMDEELPKAVSKSVTEAMAPITQSIETLTKAVKGETEPEAKPEDKPGETPEPTQKSETKSETEELKKTVKELGEAIEGLKNTIVSKSAGEGVTKSSDENIYAGAVNIPKI